MVTFFHLVSSILVQHLIDLLLFLTCIDVTVYGIFYILVLILLLLYRNLTDFSQFAFYSLNLLNSHIIANSVLA